MKILQRLKLQNFKRFQTYNVSFDNTLNLLIGDNESGKSTILLALDIALSGSRGKVEAIGLQSLFNAKAVDDFLISDRKIENLPTLFVEIYLNEQNSPDMNGKNNSEEKECDGIVFTADPIDDLSNDIKTILEQEDPNFPF